MINVNLCPFVERLEELLSVRESSHNDMLEPVLIQEISNEGRGKFEKFLDRLQKACGEVGLRNSRETVWWVMMQLENTPHFSQADTFRFTDQIYGAIVIETANTQFLKLEAGREAYYSDPQDPNRKKTFGDRVESAFPSAIPEIIGASNCFALEQWTASIFHSMRALEAPLTALAKKFSVPYDTKEWHTIIEGTEKAVREIDPQYGTDWKEAQKYFGEAARHFMFIKNAMRNHVMHVRDEYDEGKALSILQHTKELIAHLSQQLSETP
jgi:hypothetical protein